MLTVLSVQSPHYSHHVLNKFRSLQGTHETKGRFQECVKLLKLDGCQEVLVCAIVRAGFQILDPALDAAIKCSEADYETTYKQWFHVSNFQSCSA